MAKQRDSIRLELTRGQQQQVKEAIAKDAEALELTVEELEERIAPGTTYPPGR